MPPKEEGTSSSHDQVQQSLGKLFRHSSTPWYLLFFMLYFVDPSSADIFKVSLNCIVNWPMALRYFMHMPSFAKKGPTENLPELP